MPITAEELTVAVPLPEGMHWEIPNEATEYREWFRLVYAPEAKRKCWYGFAFLDLNEKALWRVSADNIHAPTYRLDKKTPVQVAEYLRELVFIEVFK